MIWWLKPHTRGFATAFWATIEFKSTDKTQYSPYLHFTPILLDFPPPNPNGSVPLLWLKTNPAEKGKRSSRKEIEEGLCSKDRNSSTWPLKTFAASSYLQRLHNPTLPLFLSRPTIASTTISAIIIALKAISAYDVALASPSVARPLMFNLKTMNLSPLLAKIVF